MEGNSVGAILETSIITAHKAIEQLDPQDGSSDTAADVDVFPGIAEVGEAFNAAEGLEDGSEGSPSSEESCPAGLEAEPAAGPVHVSSYVAESPCRTDSQQGPPSPGEAVLQEFTPLYHKYVRRVYRQCYRMLGNHEDAEDLTQEVFLQLYRKAHTFRGEANFSTWLYRLTVNTVLMQLRRRRRWRDNVTTLDVQPGSDDAVSDVLTMASTPCASSTDVLGKISLDVAIAQLSSGYREIFLLHDQEGYRHDEIAQRLDISEGTSKSQLHKARNRLRTLMG
jgi:RNA polymerase sigma-70 factor, ECF subfamily